MRMTSYKRRQVDCTRPVRVYRNLRRGGYSIHQDGRVVGHANLVYLRNVTFEVHYAGLERARASGHKNVHAFAVGLLDLPPHQDPGGSDTRASYSVDRGSFYTDRGNIRTATFVSLTPKGLFVRGECSF